MIDGFYQNCIVMYNITEDKMVGDVINRYVAVYDVLQIVISSSKKVKLCAGDRSGGEKE